MTSTFRQRLREEIDLCLKFSEGLTAAPERPLARWGMDKDLYPLSEAIRHYNRHRSESTGATDAPIDSRAVA